MIVGHTTALDSIYNKGEDNDKLEDYLKAVPHLTICNEYRLHQELLGYKEKSEGLQEIRQQVSENSEQKIALFKDEIDKNLQLILAKVNMNNLSSR
jgi:hypothetical protein